MQVTTIGLDLAKNVFQVHGIDRHSKQSGLTVSTDLTGAALLRTDSVGPRSKLRI